MESSIGDMAALGKLLDENRSRLEAMVRRRMDPRLAQRLDAEEIVSEVFLQARAKYGQFKSQADLSPFAWLYRMAKDCLIDAWRRESRDKRNVERDLPFPADSSIQMAARLIQSGTSPSEAAIRSENAERIRKSLDVLSERDKEILWMRHFDQLSYKEISQVLDISESAATVRHVRALERLRKFWEQVYGSEDFE
jgi:RNA polymerase sigma-70 factor, ECF subfamily